MNRFADDTGAKNAVLDSELKAAQAAGRGEQYKREAMEYGFAKSDGKGGIVSADGDSWTRGRASASASGMERDERMVIGGGRVNTTYNPQTGEAFTNFDAGQTTTVGRSTKLNATSGADRTYITAADGDMVKASRIKEASEEIQERANPIKTAATQTAKLTSDDGEFKSAEEQGKVAIGTGFAASILAVAGTEFKTRKPVELSNTQKKSLGPIQRGGLYDGDKRVADSEGFAIGEDGKPTKERLPEDVRKSLTPRDTGYYDGDKMVADEKGFRVDSNGNKIKRGVVSRGAGAVWDKLAGEDPANIKPGESLNQTSNNGNGHNSTNNSDSSTNETSSKVNQSVNHDNSPINDLDNNIIASSQSTSNPAQFKEALGNTPSSDIGKAQLFSALEDKRAQVMEADMPPQEKSSQLAKIATAQNELKKENPKINKAGLVGNAKNPGVFSFSEFDQLGLVVDEGKVDFEATGENTRTVLNSELDKQISAFVYLLVLDTFQYNRKNETQGRCYGKDEYG